MKLRITAKMEGFRRAGMNHYGTREYDAGRFTEQQLAAIKAEPMLVVEEVEENEPEGKAPVGDSATTPQEEAPKDADAKQGKKAKDKKQP